MDDVSPPGSSVPDPAADASSEALLSCLDLEGISNAGSGMLPPSDLSSSWLDDILPNFPDEASPTGTYDFSLLTDLDPVPLLPEDDWALFPTSFLCADLEVNADALSPSIESLSSIESPSSPEGSSAEESANQSNSDEKEEPTAGIASQKPAALLDLPRTVAEPKPAKMPPPKPLKKCDKCDKAFSKTGDLKRHMLTHDGIRPFGCAECGKRFSLKGDLRRHELIHSDTRDFACDAAGCTQRFRTRGQLDRHRVTHTHERPYECPLCQKRFTQQGDVARHRMSHTDERRFSCDRCGERFRQRAHLTAHQRTRRCAFLRSCREHLVTVTQTNSTNSINAVNDTKTTAPAAARKLVE